MTVRIEGIGHCALAASDIAKMAAFYRSHAVRVDACLDHTSQRSICFSDPEHNRLEIYFEKPDWAEIYARGRGDEDHAFTFDEPAPGWE